MPQRKYISAFTKALFGGLLFGSLISAVLPIGVITACVVIAAVLVLLTFPDRKETLWTTIAGLIVGGVLAFFVPQLNFGHEVLIALALIAVSTWM